jgi:tRNA G18 (ribose-2'-O)-methylase SpoU
MMIAIVHNIRSLHNVGSIFRTSDGAGIEKIYLTGYTPAPIDKLGHTIPQFAKVSLGAEDYLPWEKVKDIGKLIKKLKRDGYKIFAIEQDSKSVPYFEVKSERSKGERGRMKIASRKLAMTDDIVLVVGNEVNGLSKAVLKKCDKILEIPMLGKKESLNVSVAYGIVVYHLATSLK